METTKFPIQKCKTVHADFIFIIQGLSILLTVNFITEQGNKKVKINALSLA